jgi:RNA polymerase sigma-70 factor, ECF subfamily
MATAALPAVFEQGGRVGWGVRTARRESPPAGPRREPAAQNQMKPDGLKQEAKEVRMPDAGFLPGPPDVPQAQPQRAAATAEQMELAALAQRCLAGDGAAWEKLATGQHRRVYGICYRFTGSASDAEDLTQEVFLKMFRNLSSFDPAKGGFTTWLTTLTRNLLVDNYRRSRMDRASDSLDETYGGEDDGSGGPTKAERLADTRPSQEHHVAGLELRAQIQQALAQVSPDLREAVILRDLEDMDYKEIAEILGVPQGTVKSRISRGRSELARLLKRIEGQVM